MSARVDGRLRRVDVVDQFHKVGLALHPVQVLGRVACQQLAQLLCHYSFCAVALFLAQHVGKVFFLVFVQVNTYNHIPIKF